MSLFWFSSQDTVFFSKDLNNSKEQQKTVRVISDTKNKEICAHWPKLNLALNTNLSSLFSSTHRTNILHRSISIWHCTGTSWCLLFVDRVLNSCLCTLLCSGCEATRWRNIVTAGAMRPPSAKSFDCNDNRFKTWREKLVKRCKERHKGL